LNAFALWIYRAFDERFRLRAPGLRKRLLASPLVTGISIFFCFHYVVFALIVFSLDFETMQAALGRLLHG
jgi:hypothetical protein